MLCYRRGGGARVSLVIYGSSKLTRSLYHPRALHPAAFVCWLAAAALSACCAPVRCVAALAARLFGARSAEIADAAPAPQRQVGSSASSSKGANDGGGDDDTGSQPPPVVTAQSHESPLPRRDAPAGAPATAPAVVSTSADADGDAPLTPARRSSQPGDTAEEVRSPSHLHTPSTHRNHGSASVIKCMASVIKCHPTGLRRALRLVGIRPAVVDVGAARAGRRVGAAPRAVPRRLPGSQGLAPCGCVLPRVSAPLCPRVTCPHCRCA